MDGSFQFLSHEQFASLQPEDRIAYLERAVFALERMQAERDVPVRLENRALPPAEPP